MESIEVDRPQADDFPALWACAWGQDFYGYWQAFEVQGVRQVMRWIPPGRFVMGSPVSEQGRMQDRERAHPVVLSRGYWLAETACTQALWETVMGVNPSYFTDATDLPVERVSWEGCQGFIERLQSHVHGLVLRLPSEAEWEYACRAGTNTAYYWGDGFAKDKAQIKKKKTCLVKDYDPNPWGLYQMHGNVLEWCADWYAVYDEAEVVDPIIGPAQGHARVLRGGSWFNHPRNARSASRYVDTPGYRYHDIGLRLAGG